MDGWMEMSYKIMNILSIDEAAKYADGKNSVIVTGTTGQDGSFMVDYLLKNTSYEVFGGARRLSVSNHENIAHLINEKRFHLINFDLTDAHSISQTISQLRPTYFINFAAQSFVKSSWDFPAQTWDTNTKGVIHILEAIKNYCPNCHFYNAGSSEEFGDVSYTPQDEKHPLRPRSPYGASKAASRQLVKVYRDSYNLYAIQGWIFNHEGNRRSEEFVTRKITKAVARIYKAILAGKSFEPLELGNVDAKRDWSDAEDMVDAVWRMLNQETYNSNLNMEYSHMLDTFFASPCMAKESQQWLVKKLKEYVVSSDETHSIREFVERSFRYAGVDNFIWDGDGINEKLWYKDKNNNPHILVQINPSYYRLAEVDCLWGDSTSIRRDLEWIPKIDFKTLVKKMTVNDLKII